MSPTAVFQNFLENHFKFPKEIRHDIIYCQRALKAHIKVHQMVLDVYKSQMNPDPIQKKRIIDELETQIYEINAEQHFLLLRLRRYIDEFYKVLNRKGIPVLPEVMNETVSNELVPYINNQSLLIYPVNVRLRCNEEKLIEKYFEVKNEKNNTQETQENYFEILDSDEEEQNKASFMVVAQSKPKSKKFKGCEPSTTYMDSVTEQEQNQQQQMSLLKPIAQRIVQTDQTLDNFVDASQFVEVSEETSSGNLKGFKSLNAQKASSTKKHDPLSIENKTVTEKKSEDSVSKNVKMSRLNLRQALKKAHNETLAAKAAANALPPTTTNQTTATVATKPNSAATVAPAKKHDGRGRPRGVTNSTALPTVKTIEVNSSSGDSTPERSVTPQHATSSFPNEIVDSRSKPDEYGQEMFLRLFGLFTPEMHVQMQQRRSKRKRRTVQSNERSDFHYGRIEYGSYPPPEDKKKRKAFLLSPQVKQRLQSKRPKRRSVEKSDEPITTSRSSSSSPDDKRGCNECLKGGGSLEACNECKGFFHQSCHLEVDNPVTSRTGKSLSPNKPKLCPACKRLEQRLVKNVIETKQYQTLQNTAKNLEQQLEAQKTRRTSLQLEGEMFKTQMNKLYTIVNAIKSDQENSSD